MPHPSHLGSTGALTPTTRINPFFPGPLYLSAILKRPRHDKPLRCVGKFSRHSSPRLPQGCCGHYLANSPLNNSMTFTQHETQNHQIDGPVDKKKALLCLRGEGRKVWNQFILLRRRICTSLKSKDDFMDTHCLVEMTPNYPGKSSFLPRLSLHSWVCHS